LRASIAKGMFTLAFVAISHNLQNQTYLFVVVLAKYEVQLYVGLLYHDLAELNPTQSW